MRVGGGAAGAADTQVSALPCEWAEDTHLDGHHLGEPEQGVVHVVHPEPRQQRLVGLAHVEQHERLVHLPHVCVAELDERAVVLIEEGRVELALAPHLHHRLEHPQKVLQARLLLALRRGPVAHRRFELHVLHPRGLELRLERLELASHALRRHQLGAALVRDHRLRVRRQLLHGETHTQRRRHVVVVLLVVRSRRLCRHQGVLGEGTLALELLLLGVELLRQRAHHASTVYGDTLAQVGPGQQAARPPTHRRTLLVVVVGVCIGDASEAERAGEGLDRRTRAGRRWRPRRGLVQPHQPHLVPLRLTHHLRLHALTQRRDLLLHRGDQCPLDHRGAAAGDGAAAHAGLVRCGGVRIGQRRHPLLQVIGPVRRQQHHLPLVRVAGEAQRPPLRGVAQRVVHVHAAARLGLEGLRVEEGAVGQVALARLVQA